MRTASSCQTASSSLQHGGEEWLECWQTGGEDSKTELDDEPDVKSILEQVVRSFEGYGLEAGLDDTSCAGEETEGKNDNQREFGLLVDLKPKDNGYWDDGEDDVRDDVDDRVEQADVAECAVGEAFGAWVHANGVVPAGGDGYTRENECTGAGQCEAGEEG